MKFYIITTPNIKSPMPADYGGVVMPLIKVRELEFERFGTDVFGPFLTREEQRKEAHAYHREHPYRWIYSL